MLNLNDAKKIALRNMPNGKIQKSVEYKEFFIFIIFTDDPLEGNYDPYYSVNRNTKEFRDFPIFKPEYFKEVMDLFEKV